MGEIGASSRWLKYGILVSILTCYVPKKYEAKTLQNSMTVGQRLEFSDTLRSKGGFFELGFFDPNPNSSNHYLGIWFIKAKTRLVVWVSNREQPFNSTSPVLTFGEDGNLATLDGKTTYAVTNATVNDIKNTRVIMLDSGNLVMEDKNSTVFLWESFDYPTDTLLAGMKMGYDNRVGKIWAIRSWRSPTDPRIGNIRMSLDPKGSGWTFLERSIKEMRFPYGTYWAGNYLNGSWSMNIDNKEIIYNYSMPTKDYATIIYEYNKTDLFMIYRVDNNGQANVLLWLQGYSDWVQMFSLPNRECDFFGYCGLSGVCNQQAPRNPCECLPGYEKIDVDDNNDGCKRITELKCNNSSADYDDTSYQFIEVPQMTLPVRSEIHFGYESEQDCRTTCARNCTCNGYSFKYSRCSLFIGYISNVQRLPDKAPNAETLFVKVAIADMNPKDNANQPVLTGWKLWVTVITTLFVSIVSSSLFLYHFYKDKLSQVEGKDLLSYNFDESSKEDLPSGEEHGRGITGYQIPLFSFSSVCSATDDFAASNKLGKGGFGAVYKGILNNGEEIAVKRLSKIAAKGPKEVKNEALLIAELQHENLVRLLGCCLEGNENIIIYEYFQQRSLDLFLFDPKATKKLDWKNRIRIIHGIASGLNYLHEYSRLQIIHGDLKASNILLDESMNPKITDFAMTRIFGANETLATNRMFGTSGYMSPEYASKGIVSNKSDVFGFGVLMLEILSGKKNNFRTASSLNLLVYVWDLWNSNKVLDLMDPDIKESSSSNVKRYIDIALLCVQENDNERPTMADVVLYLGNEAMDLPTPKEPAFAKARALF